MNTLNLLKAIRQNVLLLFLAAALLPMISRAQQARYLAYQGYLTDANGNALGSNAPTAYDVVFRMWTAPSGGTELYAELQTVTVDKGYFSVLLGQGTAYQGTTIVPESQYFLLLTNVITNLAPRYIELTVLGTGGTSVTIAPRLQLATSPCAYLAVNALNASNAINAVSASNVTGTGVITAANISTNVGFWTSANGNVYRSTGYVGIGTTTPVLPLDVNGTVRIEGTNGTDGGLLEMGNLHLPALSATAGTTLTLNGGEPSPAGGNSTVYYSTVTIPYGNVGIGTSIPGYLLDVAGNANVRGALSVSGAVSASSAYLTNASFSSLGLIGGTNLGVSGNIEISSYPGELLIGGSNETYSVIKAAPGVLTINKGAWANVSIPSGSVGLGGSLTVSNSTTLLGSLSVGSTGTTINGTATIGGCTIGNTGIALPNGEGSLSYGTCAAGPSPYFQVTGPYISGVNGGWLGTGNNFSLLWEANGDVEVRSTVYSGSDRAIKERIVEINPKEVLAKVSAMPISEWSYTNSPEHRHIGPMAQDFRAAFGLGRDDKSIASVDEDGVALAAIKGLHQELQEKDAELQAVKLQVQQLQEAVRDLVKAKNTTANR